jgi:hypothetical protein
VPPQIDDATRPRLILRDQFGKALFALAALGIPWALVGAWSAHDFGFTVSSAGAVGMLLFGLTFLTLFGLPNVLRANGRRRLAPWVLVAVVLELIGTVLVLELFPHTELVRLPVLVGVGGLVLLALVGLCLEDTDYDPGPAGNAWWESSSTSVVLFTGFSTVLGDRYLTNWPSDGVARIGLVLPVVITLHLAWLLTHDEPMDEPAVDAEPAKGPAVA